MLYWTTCGTGLSTFAIRSSYIAVGLTAGEAVGAVLLGTLISNSNAILCGRVRGEKHLGYVSSEFKEDSLGLLANYRQTMMARASFGMRGMYLPLFFQILSNIIFVSFLRTLNNSRTLLTLGTQFGLQATYGGLSTSDFVSALYTNALHRPADAPGLNAWVAALGAGASKADVVVGFSDSLENRTHTAGATHANWVFIPT